MTRAHLAPRATARIIVTGRPGAVVVPGTRIMVGPYLYKVRWPWWRALLFLAGIRRAALRINDDGFVAVRVVQVM